MKDVFLDYNSTNIPNLKNYRALEDVLVAPYNPASVHRHGQRARKILDELTQRLAALLGVDPMGLVFVSGATEANHLGVLGALRYADGGADTGVVYISSTAHPSLLKLKDLCERLGFRVALLPTVSREKPVLDVDFARSAFKKNRPLLVAYEWVNNEFGAIEPVAELYESAREYGALVHVDAVQAFGRISTPLSQFPEATFAFSGHKYGGIGGHGVLVKPPKRGLAPLFVGGSQQNGLRAGTVSLSLVMAQVMCMETYGANQQRWFEHTAELRSYVEVQLADIFEREHPGEIFAKAVDRIPNTTLFRLAGVSSETLGIFMDIHGFMISAGSACSSGSVESSSALTNVGVDGVAAAEFVRVSTSEHVSLEDMTRFVQELRKFISVCH